MAFTVTKKEHKSLGPEKSSLNTNIRWILNLFAKPNVSVSCYTAFSMLECWRLFGLALVFCATFPINQIVTSKQFIFIPFYRALLLDYIGYLFSTKILCFDSIPAVEYWQWLWIFAVSTFLLMLCTRLFFL